MELFEFLMVLVSIIIGLGVTEILTGIARTLRCRSSVRLYWVHLLLVLVLFVALLQQWWETWGLRDVAQWSFLALLLMLTAPVCLFLFSHLVFPEPVQGADFQDYYYREMRPVWILGLVAVIASTSFRPLIFGETLLSANNATSFIGLAGFLALFLSSSRLLHGIVIPAFLAGILIDVFWWSGVIAG